MSRAIIYYSVQNNSTLEIMNTIWKDAEVYSSAII